ncbi:MAG: hypothetical protein G01um101470_305 [Parcubacteria group bacterium Gr01-1014_70]|nr:MAG: hypothetical protein G01um101470_305 [Parcubacteria group bacterium Gr01-1014_70]
MQYFFHFVRAVCIMVAGLYLKNVDDYNDYASVFLLIGGAMDFLATCFTVTEILVWSPWENRNCNCADTEKKTHRR